MSTIITTIAVIITGVFVVGLMLFKKQKSKNGELQLNNMLYDVVKKNNLFIHYKDVFNKRLIGLDRKNKKLLLLDPNKKKRSAVCISMDEIDSCDIVYSKHESSKYSEKVFLEITRKENSEPVRFCFYDESRDDIHEKTCLLLKARHWNQRINFHRQYWWINPQEYVL